MSKSSFIKSNSALYSERTTTRFWIASGITAIVGLMLLESTNSPFWVHHSDGMSLVRELGDILLASVTVTLLYELTGKRAFRDELLSVIGVSQQLRASGIVAVSDAFQSSDSIDWGEQFKNTNSLDIMFAYGRTWRNSHDAKIKALASKPNVRIRLILPDYEDTNTVRELACRFDCTESDIVGRIKETVDYFCNLAGGAIVQIWLFPGNFVFTMYRFDHHTIFAFYTHLRHKEPVPTLTLQEGGSLYDFAEKEWSGLINENNGLTRCIFPKAPSSTTNGTSRPGATRRPSKQLPKSRP
jgi:hypothetical protein